jgi:multicomponent Na+:H+ antiporter subunit C
MMESLFSHYWFYITTALMAIGLWGMLAKRNLMKKLIGMNIFQTAIILFFITGSSKSGATVPIFDPEIGVANPALYHNPLPHVLMLTAIVVCVATSGVALALMLLVYRNYKTLDEREILKRMRE